MTSKYISKSNCVLHVGEFYKKIHFFGSRFFKFHRHVIHFWSKKRGKKRLPVVIFIKKDFPKKSKKKGKFDTFSQHVTRFGHEKYIKLKKIYILVIWLEKFKKNVKISIFNLKIPIFDRKLTTELTFFWTMLHMKNLEKNDVIFWKFSFHVFCKQNDPIHHSKYENDHLHHCKWSSIFIRFTIDNLVDNILFCCMFYHSS